MHTISVIPISKNWYPLEIKMEPAYGNAHVVCRSDFKAGRVKAVDPYCPSGIVSQTENLVAYFNVLI